MQLPAILVLVSLLLATGIDAAAGRPPFVLVVDPGHGGRDLGAVGATGLEEKTVTLELALALRDALADVDGLTFVLTRNDDRYVDPQTRLAIARRAGADLLLSLHADSLPTQPFVRGVAAYTAGRGTPEVALADLPEAVAAELAPVLASVQRSHTALASSRAAARLLDRLADIAPLLERAHRPAGFAVLQSPSVPAVLLEVGYLSNMKDEAALRNTAYLDALTTALAAGLVDHIREP